jgi:hypothetical protein
MSASLQKRFPPETRVGRCVDCSSRCDPDKRQCVMCERHFGPPVNLQPTTSDAEYARRYRDYEGEV